MSSNWYRSWKVLKGVAKSRPKLPTPAIAATSCQALSESSWLSCSAQTVRAPGSRSVTEVMGPGGDRRVVSYGSVALVLTAVVAPPPSRLSSRLCVSENRPLSESLVADLIVDAGRPVMQPVLQR